jgi:hypothetical protein
MRTATGSRDSLKRELAVEILERFSEVQFIAHGSSMLPFIYPGDLLTVRSFGCSPPSAGDIVLCFRQGEFRVHRIVGIVRDGPSALYVLRGDALLEDDPPVRRPELLGRVASVLRRGEPCKLDSSKALRQRLLRSVVRRSSAASTLLLGWHALLLRRIPPARKSIETGAKCA